MRSITRHARDESGFTLPELLLGMTLMLLVGAASLVAMQAMQRSTNLTSGRQTAAASARVALARMTRDVRQATQIVAASPRLIDVAIPDGGNMANLEHVQWDCQTVAQTCKRTKCTTPVGSGCSTAGREYVITGVTNTDVFTPRNGQTALAFPANVSASNLGATSIDFVEVHLRLRVDGKAGGVQTTANATHPNDFYDGADLAQYQN
jgi:type II secretory pathway pseudopilin PulG